MQQNIQNLQENINQTQNILKVQTNLSYLLANYKNNTGNKSQLEQIIETATKNQQNIQQLLGNQYKSIFETENLLNNFDQKIKLIQDDNQKKIEDLNLKIFQVEQDQKSKIKDVQNIWEKKIEQYHEIYQEKNRQFLQLKQKLNILGQMIAKKTKQERNEKYKLLQQIRQLKNINEKEKHVQVQDIGDLFNIGTGVILLSININQYLNDLSDPLFIFIGQGLMKLNNLEVLEIKLNQHNISDQGVFSLSNSIRYLKKLKKLEIYLNYNKITGVGANYLMEGIKNLENLECLCISLRENKLQKNMSYNSDYLLFQGDNVLNNLKALLLDFSKCEIQDIDIQKIGKSIQKLRNLKHFIIHLKGNNISDQGANQLFQCISKLNDITHLEISLSSNNISVNGYEQFIQNLRKQYGQKVQNFTIRF